MTALQSTLDTAMCCLWILTYTLVLIGTLKYRYPLISPITQAITAPFEFGVLYHFIINGFVGLDYASGAYIYWTLIELAIIFVMIKKGHIKKNNITRYILSVCVITLIMFYFVGHKEQMFFFSYFNTFIGELFWLHHIQKKTYPMKSLALMAFLAKFIGDTIALPVYLGFGSLFCDVLCVVLPVVDIMFIVTYFLRKGKCNVPKEVS